MKKSILVIGASGGIGRDIVRKFLSENFVVYGIGRSLEIPKDIKEHKNFVYQSVDITNAHQVDILSPVIQTTILVASARMKA
jgi:NADP-dependent 3-hydroxy acid dehydrogenase YdfG